MMIQYIVGKKEAQKLVADGELSQVCVDGFDAIEILVNCGTRRVTICGVGNTGKETLLDDNAYAYIPAVEEVAEEKEISDLYVSNVEIAQYLELLEIPYQWALEAVDEWREDEDEVFDDAELWEGIEGIKTAYKISCEEN